MEIGNLLRDYLKKESPEIKAFNYEISNTHIKISYQLKGGSSSLIESSKYITVPELLAWVYSNLTEGTANES